MRPELAHSAPNVKADGRSDWERVAADDDQGALMSKFEMFSEATNPDAVIIHETSIQV